MRVCSEHTAEGTIWPVDAALRPEGKAGPLVRTMAATSSYYERWAKTWEFQALLKARPVAGDLELGREFVEMVAPMVWSVAERDGFVAEMQAMRAPGGRAHPGEGGRPPAQARARVGCATSSSPSSCSSSCTAAPTTGIRSRRPRSAPWRR